MIRIIPFEDMTPDDIFMRVPEDTSSVSDTVSAIIADVRARGDKALCEYTARFDGWMPETLEVTREEWDEGCAGVPGDLMEILTEARDNIKQFHEHQKREGFRFEKPGIILGQKVTPLARAGIYVPGGTAAYPSTVLMDCLPAAIAGVDEIIMVTPAKNGRVLPAILAAARLAGVSRIFKIGGAQAVAALAYGTESVPRVDKIVGPGNVFVAEAKRQVFGTVAIDMIAGPSEILIIADETANPRFVAADMLSQAEHDKNASAVLITDSAALAKAVQAELEEQLPLLPREEIAREAIDRNGKIIVAPTLEKGIAVANEIAPEHLEVCVDEPMRWLDSIRNAGSIFLGKYCPEALGDYFAGPNHTLPTSGTARFSSPLSVDDFVKRSSFTCYTAGALESVSGKIARFADEEGLHAHARSATIRFEEE